MKEVTESGVSDDREKFSWGKAAYLGGEGGMGPSTVSLKNEGGPKTAIVIHWRNKTKKKKEYTPVNQAGR